ncbi:DUF7673 family protein [Sinorhizobium meliloti]|uniref:DUF7673 family protein n=1 Tax=Sinorhizobium TaxID=28105 RepID=UPI003B51902C
MEDRVRFALEKLLNIAHDDTGQGRRVANFLLAWWNAEALGGVDIAEPVCRGSRGVRGHGHRVHLARARGGRRLSDGNRGEIEGIINAGGRRRSEKGRCYATFTRYGWSAYVAGRGQVRRSGA